MQRRSAVVVLIAVAAGSLLAAPAQGRTGRHCAYRLVTIARHGSVNVTRPELIGCYPTFAESLTAGTDGSIRVSASMTPQELTAADVNTPLAGGVLIGTEFDGGNYGGASQDYFAASTCSSTNIWEVNWVGDYWNDKFQSGRGFGGCDHNKKFENADFGGNVVTCTPNCTGYGAALGNEVSSLRWKP